MSTISGNFNPDPISLPIGSVRPSVMLDSNDANTATRIIYENGTWLRANAVYSQASYPELYSQLGLFNASVFTSRVSGLSTGTFGQNIFNVVYGNGQFVAGSDATWSTSTDGVTWTNKSTGSSSDISTITYGDSVFITCHSDGTFRTTTNFINWTSYSPNAGTPRSINYINGTYFLVSSSGVYTSTNLSSWTQRSGGDVVSLFYGNGRYVIHSNFYGISTSPDGITWTGQTSPGIFFALTYGNGLFLVCGFSGMVRTSTDAINWTSQSSGTGTGLGFASYFNGIFFIGGQGVLRTSTDNGVTWTARTYVGDVNYNMTYGNGLYLLTSRGGNAAAGPVGALNTSTDGFTWTNRSATSGISLIHPFGVLYQNGMYYIAGSYGVVKTSTNGINWPSYVEMTYGNGLYVYGGYDGLLGTSTDANNWISQTSNTTTQISALTYGNGIYMFATVGGGISTSANAVTWTARTSGTTSTIHALIYGNGLFIYVGQNGILSTSNNDGATWVARSSGTSSNIFGLTYGNGLYVYGGAGGVLSSSTNGITWTARISGTTSQINNVEYYNGIFSYSTSGGGFATSTDGINWTSRVSGTTSNLFALTYGNGTFVSVGSGGTIGTAANVQNLNFATGYDLNTQFFIPALTGQGTFGTVTTGVQPTQVAYVKAKN